MDIKPQIGSVVGPINETHWGQVFILPHAYGVVEVSFEDGGARVAGVHILSKLSVALASDPVSLHALEDIVQSLQTDGVGTLIVCVTVGRVLYIVLRGEGHVYLKRRDQFAELLTKQGSISGEIKQGDTIVLTSRQFSLALPTRDVAGVFDHRSPEEIAERLTLLLHKKPVGGLGSTALVIQFDTIPADDEPIMPMPKRVSPRVFITTRLRTHPKKTMAIMTAVLIILFGISVLLGVLKQTGRRLDATVVAQVADARHALDEGVALLSLNPVKGRQRLTAARDILAPLADTVSLRTREGREIADLLRQVNDTLTQSMQISTVTPELFFDATLLKKNGTISAIGLTGTTMGLVDRATQAVYWLDIVSKKAVVIGGQNAFYTSVHGETVYVFGEAGIYKIETEDTKKATLVVKSDEAWGNIAAMVSYGGNLYLLDNEKSRIWKYVATETGFSETREYLNPDTLPDLTQTTSIAIDGSVWLGSQSGKLWKFTAGREDTFIPKGVEPAFGNNLLLYTNDTVKNLYILDSQNHRVVVLDKDGAYIAQYAWTDSFAPTQLVVSEDQKKIFLLSTGKLYTITLK